MQTAAIVFEKPGTLAIKQLALQTASEGDIVARALFSGISNGTERMLFDGTMPSFPGMRYPLVPGYETVARVVEAGSTSGRSVGELVYIPGANCYRDAAGLFGASAEMLIVEGRRSVPLIAEQPEQAVLLALAATAHHAVLRAGRPPSLVIGHGVLGRLIARMIIAIGHPAPIVWETVPARRTGGLGYAVSSPEDADGQRHTAIIDASGNTQVLDEAIAKLQRQGVLVLAGFYGARINLDFPRIFMREATLVAAAEFTADDVSAVQALVAAGALSLDGLITHHASPAYAVSAYRTAFSDPECLKMIIDWRNAA
ncbi:chlorophyll synthesis pathway protein BchC [Rhizobium sp. G187]|uniref:chlorophyll synthesis pathway protein BchC n=1 Tax=Rhizobium sp. G187 TaxID=3451352 RepID=UPI003EE64C6D